MVTTLELAETAGFNAYSENQPRAPWSSQVIQILIGDRQVGQGATEIFTAFTAGYDRAANEECARILTDA